MNGDYLDFDDVLEQFERMMDWLAGVYVSAMNVIHYMHDKYAYERIEMALHDYAPLRTMAFGIAGMSVVADSLSAIKYAKVKVIRDETGLVVDYDTEGEFPVFGNNDNRVDHLALAGLDLHEEAAQIPDLPQRAAHPVGADDHVERGLRQGDRQHARRAPPGRAVRAGRQSDARPRQPRHPRLGRLGRQDSLSRRRRRHLADDDARARPGLARPKSGQHHQPDGDPRRLLRLDRLSHERQRAEPRRRCSTRWTIPEKYPSLTIRVSGYAVNFVRLTREQQMDVINRTFHGGWR